jgi:hypothetical protein
MKLQFGRLRGDFVISDGVEAWTLRDGQWQRTDALTAFLKSDWLTTREASRMVGDNLPDLPAEAFAGKIGRRGVPRYYGPMAGRVRRGNRG